MRFVLFCHSLVSDWNHGNAHFLRGVTRALLARGHQVAVFEPSDGWSRASLIAEHGEQAIEEFHDAFPELRSALYDPARLDLDEMLDGADVVIVHEWSDAELVHRIGRHRLNGGRYRLLFHDTHHRSATDPASIDQAHLEPFDGVLAFGEVIREIYLRRGWARHVWTWHEAADTSCFRPLPEQPREGDLVWIGNWGDDERTAELSEFLLEPVASLRLGARVHGVRYPQVALDAIAAAGAEYAGWLPNYRVPEVFARFAATVHVPRRPYVEALPGIPTIRVFEALACGIPLVSAPWNDVEGLFGADDYLAAGDGATMQAHLRSVLHDPDLARSLAESGLRTIRERHTCAHRVDQLLEICQALDGGDGASAAASGIKEVA